MIDRLRERNRTATDYASAEWQICAFAKEGQLQWHTQDFCQARRMYAAAIEDSRNVEVWLLRRGCMYAKFKVRH